MDKKIDRGFAQGDLQESKKRVQKRKRSTIWLVLSILVIIAGVAAALVLDPSTFDGLRRAVIYATAEKDENGCARLYRYDDDRSAEFAALEGTLVKLSPHELTALDTSGRTLCSESLRFATPTLLSAGKYAAAYDVGGKQLFVLDDQGLLWQKEESGGILAATIHQDGYVTVTAGKSGFKSAVSVYTAAGEPVFEFLSADRFVMTAALSGDRKTLGAVTMGQEKNNFMSYLVLYRTDREDPVATVPVTDGVVYDIGWVDDSFCLVAENGLYFYDTAGEKVGTYLFGKDYLRRCSLSGDGYAAVLRSPYRTGSRGILVTVDAEGNELGYTDVDGEVLSLHSAGRYTAVLMGDRLTIYNKELGSEAALDDISEAHQVMMRDDGSALLAGTSAARLYLP